MSDRSALSEIFLQFASDLEHELGDGSKAYHLIRQDVVSGRIRDGVQSGQANRAWEETGIEITSGNTLDVSLRDFAGRDMGAGAGLDGVGQTMLIEEVVCLAVHQTAGPGQLEIQATLPDDPVDWLPSGFLTVAGGGALKAGGVYFAYEDAEAGLDLESDSKNVRFGANGGDVTFSLLVLGRHDDDDSSSSSSSS